MTDLAALTPYRQAFSEGWSINSDRSDYKTRRHPVAADINRTPKIIKYLKVIAPAMPINIYWADKNHIVLGGNELALRALGRNSHADVVGKSIYELYPAEVASTMARHNDDVISTGNAIKDEEAIQDLATGKMRYYSVFKAPLKDDDGNIIGILGTSIEITTEKEEAARLALNNEIHKVKLLEKAKRFFVLTSKVAHDICSPLSTFTIMLKVCHELDPEKHRILVNASRAIFDIAENLLINYRQENLSLTDFDAPTIVEPRQALLLLAPITQVLSEKRTQFVDRSINLEEDIPNEAGFVFCYMQPVQLKRALSNLIDNAVQALKNEYAGVIKVQLKADEHHVFISVKDNGKGMTKSRATNLLKRHTFTSGKKNGHGLGWQQIWDLIDQNQGKITIDSLLGRGTCIHMTFPRIAAPDRAVDS